MAGETWHRAFSNGRPADTVAHDRLACSECVAARLDAPAAERDGDGRRPAQMSETGTSAGIRDHGDWTRHAGIVLSSGYRTRGLELQGKTILVTGGTGSFGTKLIEVLL